jgi:hypothetical protein
MGNTGRLPTVFSSGDGTRIMLSGASARPVPGSMTFGGETSMAIGPGSGGMRLRPLDIGDVLDETFRIYRRRFVPIITTMAVVVVPSSLLSLGVILATGFSGPQLERAIERGDYTAAIVGGAAFFVLGIVTAVISLAAVGAVTLMAASGVLGQQIGVGEAYRQAFSRFWSLLLGGLITGLTLSVLIITCIGIPFAFFIGLGWALTFPVIMIEGRGATDSLGRSWELVRGHRWRQLVIWILMILIFYLLVSVPTGLFSFLVTIVAALSAGNQTAVLLAQTGNVLVSAIAQTLFGGILYITSTLLYYDLRIRKEAFDLEQRMPTTEPPASPYQAPPSPPPTYPNYPPPPPTNPTP